MVDAFNAPPCPHPQSTPRQWGSTSHREAGHADPFPASGRADDAGLGGARTIRFARALRAGRFSRPPQRFAPSSTSREPRQASVPRLRRADGVYEHTGPGCSSASAGPAAATRHAHLGVLLREASETPPAGILPPATRHRDDRRRRLLERGSGTASPRRGRSNRGRRQAVGPARRPRGRESRLRSDLPVAVHLSRFTNVAGGLVSGSW